MTYRMSISIQHINMVPCLTLPRTLRRCSQRDYLTFLFSLLEVKSCRVGATMVVAIMVRGGA